MDAHLVATLFAFAIQSAGYGGWCADTQSCVKPPHVVFATPGVNIQRRNHGHIYLQRPNMAVISEAARAAGPTWLESVIVHEFVHVLQLASNRHNVMTCDGRADMEAEAYATQDKYLRSKGMMLRSTPVAEMRAKCQRARDAGLIVAPPPKE